MIEIALPALLALLTSASLAPIVLALLRRGRVLDHPSERSSHEAPVPRGGGVAPALAALCALASSDVMDGGDRVALTAAAATFGVVGLIEDIVGIPPLRRLALQVLAAAATGALLLDDLVGPAAWVAVFGAGTGLWLMAYVNAYNFMDGINGISVAQAIGAGVTWFLVGRSAEVNELAAAGAIVAGAALGFAPYNVPTARMFLGDVGSYFIGAWLAAVAVLGLRAGLPPEAVLAPLGLYAADTGATLLRRVRRRERWYLPHRDHAYQHLTGDDRWSHLQTSLFVLACISACGALGAVSLGGSLAARIAADLTIVGILVLYLLAPRRIASKPSHVVMA